MIATPPGTAATATGYGRSSSWLVTVRPAMMPTAEPKTASLSQWRFAGKREMATYEEKMYAGTEYFQLRCRSSAVANANVSAACPDGNEFLPLPSGRSRLVVYFNVCVRASDIASASIRSMPRCDTFGWSLIRPTAYTTDALPRSVPSSPRISPALKNVSAVSLPTSFSFTSSSKGCAASASPPPAPAHKRFSFDGRYLKFVTRCFVMALIPVCRGVGGGPAGCRAIHASRLSAVNNGDAGGRMTGTRSIASGRSFVWPATTPPVKITDAIVKMMIVQRFRMSPPLELEIDRELDLKCRSRVDRSAPNEGRAVSSGPQTALICETFVRFRRLNGCTTRSSFPCGVMSK